MEIQAALKNQYHAALKTLRDCLEQCPEDLWNEPTPDPAPFWQVIYHTLFFTQFYLQQSQHSPMTHWAQHQPGAQDLDEKNLRAYTRAEMLDYWNFCAAQVEPSLAKLDLSAPQCGFPWYPMPTLEHQLVNIRHIQHHAAALATRLRLRAGIAIDWCGRA